jgi:Tfp pilus assembly protein PilO
MHLKVLLVPMLVVLILVLAIGFIRPAVSDSQEKQLVLETVSSHLATVESAAGNIDALNTALDGQQEKESFIQHYLPTHMDQDRAIDAINFLAAQSGVVLADIQLASVSHVTAQPVMTGDPDADAAAIVEAEVLADPVEESYIASVDVRGSYENIKAFFTHISRMDRFHKVVSFGIRLDDSSVIDPAVDPTTDLVGSYKADFAYFPARSTTTMISAPIFQQSQIDFSPVAAAIERATDSVPMLENPQTGRPNPFR